MATVPHDPEELLAVVDEKDNVIDKAPRKVIHSIGKFHRHASVLILNRKGQILLQKRKDNGKLDYSASGHFAYDMSYLDGAIKETREELGLKIDKNEFVELFKIRYPSTGTVGVFVCLFEVKGDYKINEIKIDPLEVESVRYYSTEEIKQWLSSIPKPLGFAEILKLYLEKKGL